MSQTFSQTATAEETDQDLMSAIAGGDETALARLYDRYSSIVLALCLRVLNDRRDAEDVLLEVFWEIWDRADRYQPQRGTVRTYLVMLSRSRAIDRLRQTRRRQEAWEESQHVLRMYAGERDDGVVPARRVADNEQRRRLARSLDCLDDAQRKALELAFFDGLSHREIAAQLDTPLGTVKTRIRKALLKLREALGPPDDERGVS